MKHALSALLFCAPLCACQATPDEIEEVNVQEASAPSQEEMMAAMMALGAPDEHHDLLSSMVGTFDATMKIWMEPGAPPMESSGTTTNEWVLGGRFLQGLFVGEFMDMPFEGISYTGYDKLREAFVGSWIDNTGTQMMDVSVGTLGEDGKTLTFRRTTIDAMTGGESVMTEITEIIDADHHQFTMWASSPDGEEVKTLEIVYTRKR